MSYQVVEASNTIDLIARVTEQMVEGWQPLGGVSVASHCYRSARDDDLIEERTYAQAMSIGVLTARTA